MAAEHYEMVIRRREKAAQTARVQNANAFAADADELQKEVDAMNNHEEPDEDWVSMRKEIDRRIL